MSLKLYRRMLIESTPGRSQINLRFITKSIRLELKSMQLKNKRFINKILHRIQLIL